MLSAEQHAIRNKGIGSSDAAPALGLSPWKSRAQLWLEKTGRVQPEDIGGKDIVHFGNVLEDVVAQEYARRNHRRVQRRNTPYTRDFMVANIDRLIVAANDEPTAILECKTADKYTAGKWDSVPEHYRLQVEHQLVAADKHEAVLAVLIGGNQYEDFEIQRNARMSELLYRGEAEFWKYVETDTMPRAITAEEVALLHPYDNGESIVATPELVEFHRELLAIRAEVKDAEERLEQAKDAIKLALGPNANVIVGLDGKPLVTWKTSKDRARTNWEAVSSEFRSFVPDEEACLIEARHTRTSAGPRVFLPKEIKQDVIAE